MTARFDSFFGIPTILSSLGNFCSPAEAADIRQFFAARRVASADRALRQALERIDVCASVGARQTQAFGSWMSAVQR